MCLEASNRDRRHQVFHGLHVSLGISIGCSYIIAAYFIRFKNTSFPTQTNVTDHIVYFIRIQKDYSDTTS